MDHREERGVMIRAQETRNRRLRPGRRQSPPRDHRDEPLRVFVCIPHFHEGTVRHARILQSHASAEAGSRGDRRRDPRSPAEPREESPAVDGGGPRRAPAAAGWIEGALHRRRSAATRARRPWHLSADAAFDAVGRDWPDVDRPRVPACGNRSGLSRPDGGVPRGQWTAD